jgi:DNA anti-recombination protein RmuC
MARRSDFHKLLESLRRQREQRVDEKRRLNHELVARLERIDGLIDGIDEAIAQVREILAQKKKKPAPPKKPEFKSL